MEMFGSLSKKAFVFGSKALCKNLEFCPPFLGLAIAPFTPYFTGSRKRTKAMGVLAKPDLPPGANLDWTIPQGFERYGEAEHRTWTTLYERQAEILPGRACDAFLHGLDALDLHGQGIPDFARLNETLSALTGWRIVAVPGLVPDAVFFDHLAHRRFPAGNFIRGADELDYLKLPDIFHDVFGHVPMLTDPVFADYMQAYGKGGLRALSLGHLADL